MVSYPLIGVIKRIYPYAALTNLNFIDEVGYIAGVTNPMFNARTQWHDVCCEVDQGKLKVTKNANFYHYD